MLLSGRWDGKTFHLNIKKSPTKFLLIGLYIYILFYATLAPLSRKPHNKHCNRKEGLERKNLKKTKPKRFSRLECLKRFNTNILSYCG